MDEDFEFDFDNIEIDFPADGSIAYEVESWIGAPASRIKSLWEWHDPSDVELKIAVCGAAGTGKKRLAHALGAALDIPVISGVARTANKGGATLNKKANLEDEFMIFLGQLYEQMEYDEYVTAGTLIDVLVHAEYGANVALPKHRKILTALGNIAHTTAHNEYPIVFYCPLEEKPKGDGIRSVDMKYLHEIDAQIRYYLGAFDVDFLPVQGTTQEKLDICLAYLREYGLLEDRD